MALEVAWSWGKGATGDWSASCPVGPVSACGPDMDVGGLVTPLALAAGAVAPWIDPDAIGACQEGFGGGDVARAVGYLAHVPRG
jgi:hypothetical protein